MCFVNKHNVVFGSCVCVFAVRRCAAKGCVPLPTVWCLAIYMVRLQSVMCVYVCEKRRVKFQRVCQRLLISAAALTIAQHTPHCSQQVCLHAVLALVPGCQSMLLAKIRVADSSISVCVSLLGGLAP